MNPPYKLLNYGLLLQQATLVDIKLTNVDKNAVGGLITIDDIFTHLGKLNKNSRTVGVPYTMLVPKIGYVPLPGYTPAQYQAAVVNFDIKYYTFEGGVDDINFVEIDFGYTYIRYASDLFGTDFSVIPDVSLDFMAILTSPIKIETPVVNDFIGLWYKYKPLISPPGTLTQFTTNFDDGVIHTHELNITGLDGTSGTSGTSGGNGTSGSSGTSGRSGSAGTSGTSGINGTSGTSGSTGSSGVSIVSVEICKPDHEYGALYNWWAVTDIKNIASSGWHVPSNTEFDTLATYLGGASIAGGKLKESGTTYWDAPNTGANNSSGFNGRGSGIRGMYLKQACELWTNVSYDATYARYVYFYYSITNFITSLWTNKTVGASVRLIKDSSILTNGQTGTYIGNDGKVYPTICIGTQEWISCNLMETKYRNGDWIHGFDGGVYTPISNVNWAALTTEAMCYYDDLPANGGTSYCIDGELIITYSNSSSGTAGVATGTSGTSGTSGATGSSGTSGTTGTSGTSGISPVIGSWIDDITFDYRDIVPGTIQVYVLDPKASFGYTIYSNVLETDNGTLTGVTLYINGTPVTSLSSQTITTVCTETLSTGANVVIAGDRVEIITTVGYTGNPASILGKLKTIRT